MWSSWRSGKGTLSPIQILGLEVWLPKEKAALAAGQVTPPHTLSLFQKLQGSQSLNTRHAICRSQLIPVLQTFCSQKHPKEELVIMYRILLSMNIYPPPVITQMVREFSAILQTSDLSDLACMPACYDTSKILVIHPSRIVISKFGTPAVHFKCPKLTDCQFLTWCLMNCSSGKCYINANAVYYYTDSHSPH